MCQVENAEFVGPNALLFLQLLIALVTMSAVNVSAISIGFLLVSLVTNRVSLEEECLPSFEVLICLLNLAASCLDVKVRPDPGYVVKQCPRIVMNKIFDWH